jgi:crotonobetainyl-CoA:carnitine CoA-transferase CaiB-like acyl-CoA transferase
MEPCAGALHGVRVLNLADISGAYCAKLLADLGADVIAVEPPGGSPMRHVGPFYGGARNLNRSICFWHYHTNQRSVMLDLETADGRRRLRDLAVSADILVETSTPESLEHLGLGYQHLSACNPGLIVVSITPFGQTGPHRFQRTTDLVAQAVGGMLSVNGTPDAPPLPGAGLPAYHSASMYGAIGALLALHARHATGRGQRVDISLQESVLACVEHASSLFHHEGRIASRQGGLHWTRDFHVGRCADGYVVHGTLGDWTSLAEWVKAEALAQELAGPEWEDVVYRRTHCRQLFAILDAWARHQRAHDLVEGAQLRRLPYARVRPPEALRNDAQLRARGFYVAVPHPELSTTLTYPGAPYVFSRTPWCIHRRPPLLGEHAGAVWHAGEEAGSAASRVPHSSDPLSSRRGLGPSTADRQPLRGLRVLDFTWVVAGPLATRILADHGAEVIKVERPGAGDFGSRRGGLTGNLNRGKRSIVIDMGNRVGLQLAQRLAAASDVVIDNFSARVMSNWGLDDGRLRELNPRIVAVHMSGFGRSGPARDHVSYGPTLQALCGHTWLMRSRGEPVGWGFSYSDMVAGVSAAFAVLAALWHRRRTGEGQCIDLSQFETCWSTAERGRRLTMVRKRCQVLPTGCIGVQTGPAPQQRKIAGAPFPYAASRSGGVSNAPSAIRRGRGPRSSSALRPAVPIELRSTPMSRPGRGHARPRWLRHGCRRAAYAPASSPTRACSVAATRTCWRASTGCICTPQKASPSHSTAFR